MTREEYKNELFKTYRLVKALSFKNGGEVLRLRHKSLGRDLLFRSVERSLPLYEVLKEFSHPNLVRIYDVISCSDGTVVLEEALTGMTVQETLDTEHFTYRTAFPVINAVADALSAIHSLGFVHRDVKPSNVMLTDDGGVRLLDYDAGRFFVSSDDTIRLGTTGYAAPEQYVGASGPRTDVFAMGVLLNMMLTGKHPSETLPSDPKARRIIKKATAINPDDRYRSAEEFRKAL